MGFKQVSLAASSDDRISASAPPGPPGMPSRRPGPAGAGAGGSARERDSESGPRARPRPGRIRGDSDRDTGDSDESTGIILHIETKRLSPFSPLLGPGQSESRTPGRAAPSRTVSLALRRPAAAAQ